MGEAGVMLVARRGGCSGEASTRCPAIISETTYSSRQILSRRYLVSSGYIFKPFTSILYQYFVLLRKILFFVPAHYC